MFCVCVSLHGQGQCHGPRLSQIVFIRGWGIFSSIYPYSDQTKRRLTNFMHSWLGKTVSKYRNAKKIWRYSLSCKWGHLSVGPSPAPISWPLPAESLTVRLRLLSTQKLQTRASSDVNTQRHGVWSDNNNHQERDTQQGQRVRMASDAELRMMMMMNTMDLEQEGPMSSEDRLFMGTQQGLRTHQQSQVWRELKVTMSLSVVLCC